MQTRKTTRRRLITVVLAPTAALAAWGAAKALGAELVLKGGATVDASDVVLAAFVAALAAWLVARWIEHHTRRPRAVGRSSARRLWRSPESARPTIRAYPGAPSDPVPLIVSCPHPR